MISFLNVNYLSGPGRLINSSCVASSSYQIFCKLCDMDWDAASDSMDAGTASAEII
jgi:hypothetical protein